MTPSYSGPSCVFRKNSSNDVGVRNQRTHIPKYLYANESMQRIKKPTPWRVTDLLHANVMRVVRHDLFILPLILLLVWPTRRVIKQNIMPPHFVPFVPPPQPHYHMIHPEYDTAYTQSVQAVDCQSGYHRMMWWPPSQSNFL